MALEEDEELEVQLSPGNAVTIKYKAMSELQPSGIRWVHQCAYSVCPVALTKVGSLMQNHTLGGLQAT